MATPTSDDERPRPFPRPILCAVLDAPGLGWRGRGSEDAVCNRSIAAAGDLGSDAAGAGSDAAGAGVETLAAALFTAGVDWIQLRDRSLDAVDALAIARAIVRAAAPYIDRRVILNRRVDVAAAIASAIRVDAAREETAPPAIAGAHLGFDALSPANARALLGPDALLGASFHSVGEVEAAARVRSPIDYAHLAPIWDPRSKPATGPALGLGPLGEAAATGLPLLAQGGLDAERARDAIRAGATGIAVTGLLGQAEDPARVARSLRAALDEGARSA